MGENSDLRIDEHGRILVGLERRVSSLEVDMRDSNTLIREMMVKSAEMHAENRMRLEQQDRQAHEEAEETRHALAGVASKVDQLSSVRGWAGWAIVTASSAAISYVTVHFMSLTR